MLRLMNINTFYGEIHVLRNISLHIEEGEIVTLIGANGAGKTTLLNTISGIINARTGQIVYNGKDIARKSADRVVKLGISQVPEGRQIFNPLTVLDNLKLGSYIRYRRDGNRKIQRDIEELYLLFPILKERQHQLAGTLSGGEQQMLAIGRALMCRPRILLLDEPSMGLAPLVVTEIFKTIARLREVSRTTIFLVEQNARAALKLSDRGYVMETGKIMFEADAADLLENKEVQRAYLGKEKKPIWA
jgi:branched-chain amino acid transport system ATP-binding protein